MALETITNGDEDRFRGLLKEIEMIELELTEHMPKDEREELDTYLDHLYSVRDDIKKDNSYE